MTVPRTPVEALDVVPTGDLVFRLVRPEHIDLTKPRGAQLQTSALPSDQYTPNDHSYGASVYVKSRLPQGVEQLYQACPKWRTWRTAEVPVAKVVELGVGVVLSPQDCEIEEIRHAHASLIGVDRPRRNRLLRLIEAHLLPQAS
ncbi:MAG: hypothetical protein JW751_19530 [Polyangiaceae bacterium]|nr:hypothetical protein [Polyangiaceae bacterium]